MLLSDVHYRLEGLNISESRDITYVGQHVLGIKAFDKSTTYI